MTGAERSAGAEESAGRLFLGINLPEELRAELAEHLRRRLDGAPLPGRPVPLTSWHLTLRFLGDTSHAEMETLVAGLQAADLGSPFHAAFGGFGAFRRPARASVLWLGVEQGAGALATLARRVEAAARSAGFPAEERPFRAHLTLSRLQPPCDVRQPVERLGRFPRGVELGEVVLFRSHLGSGPARYEALRRFPLKPPNAA